MNKELLNNEVQDFIKNYTHPIATLAFSGSPFKEISVQELIQQIEGRAKVEKKLPSWYASLKVIYPPKLNIEQTSSEITAAYKSTLVSGDFIADITGGFGVDSVYFAKRFKQVFYFEINDYVSQVATHNFKILGADNIITKTADGLSEIENMDLEVIYIDPSRRHDTKGKVYFLKDCKPNVPENLDFILSSCKTVLIKTSPMLDISIGLEELGEVFEIHIVAVENEVKELLWLIKRGKVNNTLIKTINIKKGVSEKFEFNWGENPLPIYGNPKEYLYEPNAAIMKSGAFNQISESFQIAKLHTNSHLYTSEVLIDFPGRRFRIKEVVPYSKSEMKARLNFKKANIATRNFPESVDVLRKKWKLKDGGDTYLFFTTIEGDKKVMLVCSRLNYEKV